MKKNRFNRAALVSCVLLWGLAAQNAWAQPGAQTVAWNAATGLTVRPGGHASLVVQGTVREGWHLYALKQLENGPTPLSVKVEANDLATPAGAVQGSKPLVVHDRAFNLDTPYYTHGFTVTVPVRLKPHLAAGRQSIPVSLRFQTCNGATCEPPRTVHIAVPVDVQAGR